MKFVGRISGTVTYSDGSSGRFAAHIDERNNVSVNSGSENVSAILELQNSNSWLQDMMALVTGTTNPITLSPSGSPTKNVTDAVLHFSGLVARDNNSWVDFAAQYEIKADGEFLINGNNGAYEDFTDEVIIPWLSAVAGEGNVSR